LSEAERLYTRAQAERTAAAVNDAIEHHKQLCATLTEAKSWVRDEKREMSDAEFSTAGVHLFSVIPR
jgi:hypothetical protein